MRHAQRVFEWLVNGLQAGALAPEPEIEALLLCALPFHATPQFSKFITCVVSPRPRKRWEWLLPVVKQSKPAALSFLVDKCPESIHRRAIDWAFKLATASIPPTHAASFIANVTARWVSNAPPEHRRSVVLKCLQSVNGALLLRDDQVSHLICALFVVKSSAAVAGIDGDVASAIAHAAVAAICTFQDVIAQAALHCLTIMLNCYGDSCLPLHSGLQFVRDGKLSTLLGLEGDGRRVYASIVRCILGGDLPKVSHLRTVQEALLGNGASFLSAEFVTEVIATVLDVCSPDIGEENELDEMGDRAELVAALVDILAPLSRGRFAKAADLGLRKHFDGRPKKRIPMRFALADEALSIALHGTPFQVIKAKSDEGDGAAAGLMTLAALDHPERKVRKNALEQLAEIPTSKKGGAPDISPELQSKLLSMITTEENRKVVLCACDCALKFAPVFSSKRLLRSVGPRLVNELSKTFSLKGKTVAKLRKQIFSRLLLLCDISVKENKYEVCALLVGLVLNDVFVCEEADESEKSLRTLLSRSLETGTGSYFADVSAFQNGSALRKDVATVAQGLWENPDFVTVDFLRDLRQWNAGWALQLVSTWMRCMTRAAVSSACEESAKSFLPFIELLANDVEATEYAELLSLGCTVFCAKQATLALPPHALQLWTLAATRESDSLAVSALQSLTAAIGLDRTVNVLKIASLENEKEAVRRTSLRWFLNISVAHPSDVVRRNAVTVALIVWYGKDTALRAEAHGFCEQITRDKEICKDTGNHVTVLCKVLLSLRTSHAAERSQEGNLAKVIYDGLEAHVTSSVRSLDLPSPLTKSKEGEGARLMVKDIFKVITLESKIEDRLSLFRAMEGHVLTYKKSASACVEILFDTLKQVEARHRNDECIEPYIELIARVVMLLLSVRKLSFPSEHAKAAMKHIFSLLAHQQAREEPGLPKAKRLNVTLYATGALIWYKIDEKAGSILELKDAFVKALLLSSTKSSETGAFVHILLEASLGEIIPLKSIVPSIDKLRKCLDWEGKKPKLESEELSSPLKDTAHGEGVGALETVRRWCTRQVSSSITVGRAGRSLKSSLWKFLQLFSSHVSEEKSYVEEDMEYILHLSLDTLCGLYRVVGMDSEDDDFAKLEALIVFLSYPGKQSQSEETAASRTIRKATLMLVEVLAPFHRKDLHTIAPSVIETLVNNIADYDNESGTLDILIPCLLKGGNSFDKISKWLCKAAFNERRNKSERARLLPTIASCCRHAPDAKDAVRCCLNDMMMESTGRFSNAELGSECAYFLSDAHLPVKGALNVISKSNERIRCFFALNFVMEPEFGSRLFEAVNLAQTRDKSNLISCVSEMFTRLAFCNSEEDSREMAMGATLALLPMPGLAMVFEQAVACDDIKIRLRIMNSFVWRLANYETTLLSSWKMNGSVIDVDGGDSNDGAESFLKSSARCLSTVLKSSRKMNRSSSGAEDLSVRKLKQTSITAIEMLLKRFGTHNEATSMELSGVVLDVMDDCIDTIRSHNMNIGGQDDVLSAAVKCISSVISRLGAQAVELIPRGLNVAVTLMGWAFGAEDASGSRKPMKGMSALTTAAVQMCTCVLDCVPMFFGQNSLQSLTALLLGNSSHVLEEVVDMAIRNMPCSSAVGAIWAAVDQLDTKGASLAGIGLLLKCLHLAISTMKRSEVRSEMTRIMEICFRSLEYSRESENSDVESPKLGSKHSAGNKIGDGREKERGSSRCDMEVVDEACGDILTSLTLRLSESDFKKLLGNLVQWFEAGSLPEPVSAACADMKIVLDQNMVRALPFFKIVVKLFKKLESIMVPHYLQLLDKVLGIISAKNWSVSLEVSTTISAEKKRKRSSLEEDGKRTICLQYAALQGDLQDVCVDSLICLLKQPASAGSLKESVFAKIQGALLVCFDERSGDADNVTKALTSLGARFLTVGGVDDSREESRQLLISLSRELLLRTRSEQVRIREGALVASKEIASEVGDEYLVTLPESMPILAEVIDDENSNVQKAAKAFVTTMESLAGEPLLNQLK